MQGQVPTAFRAGVLFFVGVNGEVTKRISLTDMELLVPTRLAHLPVTFRYTLENQGGIHVTPSGFLTVRNWRGRVIHRSPLNAEQAYVLPASRRQFTFSWRNNEENETSGTFWSEVRKEWKEGLLGPYRLRIEPEKGETEIRIFIWPWHLFPHGRGWRFLCSRFITDVSYVRLARAGQAQKL